MVPTERPAPAWYRLRCWLQTESPLQSCGAGRTQQSAANEDSAETAQDSRSEFSDRHPGPGVTLTCDVLVPVRDVDCVTRGTTADLDDDDALMPAGRPQGAPPVTTNN